MPNVSRSYSQRKLPGWTSLIRVYSLRPASLKFHKTVRGIPAASQTTPGRTVPPDGAAYTHSTHTRPYRPSSPLPPRALPKHPPRITPRNTQPHGKIQHTKKAHKSKIRAGGERNPTQTRLASHPRPADFPSVNKPHGAGTGEIPQHGCVLRFSPPSDTPQMFSIIHSCTRRGRRRKKK